jgi:hypothetical protein
MLYVFFRHLEPCAERVNIARETAIASPSHNATPGQLFTFHLQVVELNSFGDSFQSFLPLVPSLANRLQSMYFAVAEQALNL